MGIRIDAHQHFWQLSKPFQYDWLRQESMASICRDFLPSDLWPLLQSRGITHSVFVQTQHNVEESFWILELAKSFPFIAGVVGWVDLASDQCEEQLIRLKQDPKFVGVRHVTQDEPDDRFIVRDNILRGLKVLEKHQIPFDLLFYSKHLQHAPAVARHVPNLPLVIDHLSKPNLRLRDAALRDHFAQWKKEMSQASSYPNVYCKLSGLVTEANWGNWSVEELRPFIETALELFGPSRCMYGSDWPVCVLSGSYQQVYDATAQCVSQLSVSEQEMIFCQTAKSFYRLSIAD